MWQVLYFFAELLTHIHTPTKALFLQTGLFFAYPHSENNCQLFKFSMLAIYLYLPFITFQAAAGGHPCRPSQER
jgi:hypothetical protein